MWPVYSYERLHSYSRINYHLKMFIRRESLHEGRSRPLAVLGGEEFVAMSTWHR